VNADFLKDLFPFAAALALILLSPMFTKKAQNTVDNRIRECKESVDCPVEDPPSALPPYYLHQDTIREYVAVAIDVAQGPPLLILASIGIVFAFQDITATLAAFAVGGIALLLVMIPSYPRHKLGLTLVNWLALVVNAIGALLVIWKGINWD
jgi:hypothetical protein